MPSSEEEVPHAHLPHTACPDLLQSWLSCQAFLTPPPGSPQYQSVHAQIIAFAASTALPFQVPRIRFDTDSFVIGVDTFASTALSNHPDQFEDLRTHDDMEVERIQGGLGIKGTGTFKFHIKDNEGGVHLIKIPNSKYVPDLKVCLLLPHHWAQEAKDHYPVLKGTKMDTNDKALTLIWKQQKYRRTIPYHPLINTPSFRTAPALRTYRAFVALFEAAEVQYH